MSEHKSPGSTRTSRNVALAMGTNPAGFAGQLYPFGPEMPLAVDHVCDFEGAQGSPALCPPSYTNLRKK